MRRALVLHARDRLIPRRITARCLSPTLGVARRARTAPDVDAPDAPRRATLSRGCVTTCLWCDGVTAITWLCAARRPVSCVSLVLLLVFPVLTLPTTPLIAAMLPAQRNKVDISVRIAKIDPHSRHPNASAPSREIYSHSSIQKLTEEEQKLFRLYGKLPNHKNVLMKMQKVNIC